MDNNQIEHRVKILTFISIVLFFLLMVCLFLILLIVGRTKSSQSGPIVTSTSTVDKLEIRQLNQEEIDSLNQEAQKNMDTVSSSKDFNAGTYLDDFYKNKAESEQNVSICPLISNNFSKSECLDQTYLTIATQDRNLAACDKLSLVSYQASCRNEIYYYLAGDNPSKAKDYCNSIAAEQLKSMCFTNYVK